MANKREIDNILEGIEEEYTHDLAIHLYSTHLLHNINPYFPGKKWSSWPLPVNDVPDPRSGEIYMDVNSPQFESTVGASRGEVSDGTNPDTDFVAVRNKSILGVKITEQLTSPSENLKLELKALLEKKIYEKVHDKLKVMKKGSPAVEIQQDILDILVSKLKSQVDEVLDTLIETRTKAALRWHSKKLMNWLDILIAKLNADISTNRAVDVRWYREIFSKLSNTFEHDYKYETEDGPQSKRLKTDILDGGDGYAKDDVVSEEDDSDEDDDIEEAEDEEEEDSESSTPAGSDSERLSSNLPKKRKSRRVSDPKSYEEHVELARSSYEAGMLAKRNLFLKTLEIQERFQCISYENKSYSSKSRSSWNVPDGYLLSRDEEKALRILTNTIDENTFIV